MLNVLGAVGNLFFIAPNGIKLKAERLYKRLVCGGLILGCVSTSSQIKI